MKGHTYHAPLFFIILVLTACSLATPVHAQTNTIFTDFNVDIIQGIDTIKNPGGQVLFTENDLAISEALSPTVAFQIANPSLDPVFDPSNIPSPPYFLIGTPGGVGLSAYATANLSQFVGNQTDFQFLLNEGNSGPNFPSLLLTANGTILSGPTTSFTGPASTIPPPAIFNDLTGSVPFPAAVVSATYTPLFGNDQWIDDVINGNTEVNAILNVNYDVYNITQVAGVVPEASSLQLLAAGLVGFGLFGWSRRRKVA